MVFSTLNLDDGRLSQESLQKAKQHLLSIHKVIEKLMLITILLHSESSETKSGTVAFLRKNGFKLF